MKIRFNKKVKGVGTKNKELTKTKLKGADGKLLSKSRYNARRKKDGTEKITAVTKSVDKEGRKVKETVKIVDGKETRSIKVGGKKRGGQKFVAPDKKNQYGKGGKVYKNGGKFPDLTGDGKVTRADILKGRGVGLKKKK